MQQRPLCTGDWRFTLQLAQLFFFFYFILFYLIVSEFLVHFHLITKGNEGLPKAYFKYKIWPTALLDIITTKKENKTWSLVSNSSLSKTFAL